MTVVDLQYKAYLRIESLLGETTQNQVANWTVAHLWHSLHDPLEGQLWGRLGDRLDAGLWLQIEEVRRVGEG